MTFKDIFQNFPGPGIFKKKNPGLSRRHGNPVYELGNIELFVTLLGPCIVITLTLLLLMQLTVSRQRGSFMVRGVLMDPYMVHR